MAFSVAQTNMIKQQIRTFDVTDEAIVHLFAHSDRAAFVAPEYQDLAYADMMLPIACGQKMLAPKIQAKMLQALNLKAHERVLEIGTGNGYLTSLLAQLAQEVISVEIHRELSREAEAHLLRIGVNNVKLQVGNGASGWKLDAPVDAVIITGALPILPKAFKSCIHEHGRVLAILGDGPAMVVSLIENDGATYHLHPLFETEAPPLLKAVEPERFVF